MLVPQSLLCLLRLTGDGIHLGVFLKTCVVVSLDPPDGGSGCWAVKGVFLVARSPQLSLHENSHTTR